jgi:aspartyl-tRNA(Asn)/glutamyl-tRNA(Gln) amidotransferase subunit A
MSTPSATDTLISATSDELVHAYREMRISPVAVLEAHLARIAALDPIIRAFVTLRADDAISDAHRSAERWVQRKPIGPLDGVPIAIKDLMAVANLPMTAGSSQPWPAAEVDAAPVRKLREAGAIILGTNTLHEYAFGGTSVNPHVGTPRNPRDPSCIAGGSSGGSAAAVAAGMAVGALGTETGNSIRRPAAFCGVVGFKPTFGRVSRQGVIPLAPTLDHVGVLTRSVRDAARFADAISGHDPFDAGSRRPAAAASGIRDGVNQLVVGVPRPMIRDLNMGIERAFDNAIENLASQGARVTDVNLPLASRWTAIASSIIMHAEAAVIHARRFGAYPEGYGDDVAARIVSGQAFLGADLARAHWLRSQIAAEMDDVFGQHGRVDVIVAPAVPATAPPLAPGAFVPGDAPWSTDVGPFHLQRLPSLLGLPAGSVPVAWTAEGLPLPLMAMASQWHDPIVLATLDALCAPIPIATPPNQRVGA